MHPTPAIELLAPSSSSSSDHETPELAHVIGTHVAIAVGAVAAALAERQVGSLTPATKMYGGDAIARCYELRRASAGELDFDAIAREHAPRILLEHGCSGVDARAIDVLVEGVIDIVRKVAKSVSN